MTIRIAENIRQFRKSRKLTQEQLAEAVGVTVGAVSKWESGASMPDISLIVGLALFFETSVDVLLGYDWKSGGMSQTLDRIRSFRNEKKFDEACIEAEMGLKQYPNSFDVVFQCAILYSMKGVERREQKSFRRALTLFNRALELIDQNTNERINDWTIRNDIARIYLSLDQTDKALSIFKENNAAGLNDSSIGYTLSVVQHKPQDALPYLSDAFVTTLAELFGIMMSLADAYEQMKDYNAALDTLLWMQKLLTGLNRPGKVSYVDKQTVILAAACASVCATAGDMNGARAYLRQAKRLAAVFDADPQYDFSNVRFVHSTQSGTAFDELGDTAYTSIHRLLSDKSELSDSLLSIWEEVMREK